MADACQNDPNVLVMAIADQLRHHLEVASRAAGLTAPQAKLLVQLEEPRRMSDLAESQSCDPSTITDIVGRMERDGMVQRDADPSDGRARRVVLTAAGVAAREAFLGELAGMPDPFAALTDEQRGALTERLQQADRTTAC